MFRLRRLTTVKALPVLVLLCLGMLACGGHGVKDRMDPQDRLDLADRLRSENKCLQAVEEYEKLLSEFPTPQVAERARFNLAVCHLELNRYDLARAEFEDFIDSYPKSERADNALYMIGLTYLRAAPRAERDQTQTVKALNELTLLLREYPDTDVREEADRAVVDCRSRLAEKEYLAGRLYLNTKSYKAARIYFDSVIDNYGDTSWAAPAMLMKGKSYAGQKLYREAVEVFGMVVEKFPGTDMSAEAAREIRRLEGNLPGGEDGESAR